MTANRRKINDLRYLTRNNLIIPNNLDTRKNRTVNRQLYVVLVVWVVFISTRFRFNDNKNNMNNRNNSWTKDRFWSVQ